MARRSAAPRPTPQFAPARVVFAVLDQITDDPGIRVVALDNLLFHDEVELFRQRPEMDRSLTDCIPFVVMQDEGISEPRTADDDFEQAGFVALSNTIRHSHHPIPNAHCRRRPLR
jgi:predicted nucleic acid-binding protein